MRHCLLLLLALVFSIQGFAHPKTLVVMLGQTRAYEITYQNIKDNLIDPLQADLAICTGTSSRNYSNNPFYQQAKYHFINEDPIDENYEPAFDLACAEIVCSQHLSIDPRCWRKLLSINGNFLGGIQGRLGSGAILMLRKLFLLKNIIEHGLLDQYDFFILTRSDFLYTLPHPPIECFESHHLYMPQGEFYGGLQDRHVVIPRAWLVTYLDTFSPLLLNIDTYYRNLQSSPGCDAEKFLLVHCQQTKLFDRIAFFPYVMYLVKGQEDLSRWSQGHFHPDVNYSIKFPTEYALATAAKEEFDKSHLDLKDFYLNKISKHPVYEKMSLAK